MEILKDATAKAAHGADAKLTGDVRAIIADIEERGEAAVRDLSARLDDWSPEQFRLSAQQIDEIVASVDPAVIDDIRENLPHVRQALRELPAAIRELSDRAAAGNLSFDLRSEEMERIRRELEEQRTQRYWLIVAMTSIISGTIVLTMSINTWLGGGLLVAGLLGLYSGRPKA